MTDKASEALRRFGDRLDWVFPPERDEALVELIAPLFHDATAAAPGGGGASMSSFSDEDAPHASEGAR